MKKQKTFWWLLITTFSGFLWAYSFSTRVGLLFVVPLWLKVVVLGGLATNFSMLGYYLFKQFINNLTNKKVWLWVLIGSTALSILIFLFAPYQRIPFRTTHHLEITALDSEVKIKAIYSPDNNIISRDEFEVGENVENYHIMGFRLAPGSEINYRRAQTGGLTFVFTIDSGPMTLTWDRQTQTIDLSAAEESRQALKYGWHLSAESETDIVTLALPGNTWGEPDLYWSLLGVLLPIGDFFTLTSIFGLVIWLGLHVKQYHQFPKFDASLIKPWTDSLIVVGLSVVMIRIGFPNFLPYWFLSFFLPAAIYLSYHQTKFLIHKGLLTFSWFSNFQNSMREFGDLLKAINHNRWVFWVSILIIAIAGSAVQLHLTAPGMGISGDSVHYMEGTRNLALGNGYVRHIIEGEPSAISGFPPTYSIFLLPGVFLGMEVEQSARYLNILLIFLTLVLSGWVIKKTTKKTLPALFGSLFILMAQGILSIFAWVMSEPLFIVLLLVLIFCLVWKIYQPSHWKTLLIGLISGIMINTRLAGVAFLPPFAIIILIFQKGAFRQRLRDAIIFGITALILPAAFFIRNSLVAETISESRGLTLATFPQEYWEIIGREVYSWFNWQVYFNFEHQRFNAMFAALSIVLLLIAGWLVFRKQLDASRSTDPIIYSILLSLPSYFSLIILNTILFTPQQTEYGLTRYMIPIFVLLVIVLSKLLSDFWKQPYLFPKVTILFFVLVNIMNYNADFSRILQEQRFGYRQYTDRKNLCGDEVLTVVNTIPNTQVFSNNCEYFYFMSGQRCQHVKFDENAYQPGGEIYQAIKTGGVIAHTEGFGSNPPGLPAFLDEVAHFDSACYLEFYRWPDPSD